MQMAINDDLRLAIRQLGQFWLASRGDELGLTAAASCSPQAAGAENNVALACGPDPGASLRS